MLMEMVKRQKVIFRFFIPLFFNLMEIRVNCDGLDWPLEILDRAVAFLGP